MPDYSFKLNFDDNGIAARLIQLADLVDELRKEVVDYDKIQKTAGKDLVETLMKAENEAAKFMQDVSGISGAVAKGFSKDKIVDTAVAIAKSGAEGKKLLDMFRKMEQLKLDGAEADILDMAKDMETLISKIKITEEQFKVLEQNTSEVAAAFKDISGNEFQEVATKAEVLTKEFSSAKAELKALTNAINSGKLDGDELQIAINRAGELKDRIGDVSDQINRTASDTPVLDNIGDSMQLAAAGFQLAEGAAALFGDESKELQQSLLKLNAVMAISNGLNDIGQQITKKGTLANRAAAAAQALWTAAIGGSTGAVRIFRIALASIGIGLLIGAISLLVANWDKVKAAVDRNSKAIFDFGKKITVFMPPLNILIKGIEYLYNNFDRLDNIASGVIDGIVAGLGVAGDVINKIFVDKDFSGAIASAKQLGTKVGSAYKKGYDESVADDVNKARAKDIDNLVKTQKEKLEILRASGKDTDNLNISIHKNELASLKLAGAEKEKIQEAELALKVAYAERSKKIADKAIEADKKAKEKQKELLEQYKEDIKKLNDEILNASRNNDLAGIDDSTIQGQIQKLKLQQEFDKQDLEERKKITLERIQDAEHRATLTAAFKALEIEQSEAFNRELYKLEKQARDEYNKLITDSAKENVELIRKAKEEEAKAKLDTDLKAIRFAEQQQIADIERELKYGKLSVDQRRELERQKLEIVLASLQAQRQAFGIISNEETISLDNQIKDAQAELNRLNTELAPQFKNAGDLFKGFLKDAFGVEGEDANQLIEGFGALKKAVIDVVNAGYQAELDSLDKSIQGRKDRINELDGLIQEEFKKKEAGYANDYDALVNQKANEEALVKQDNKKRIEIQKQQLKVQTALQAAEQISSLATAVAGIFSKSAGALGVFGIPIAIAGIVSLFALFKSYKNQVKSLTAYKGGKISDYLEPGQTASSDRPGYGRGHRVEGTNLRIGADEFLVNAVSTSSNLPFLRAFNTGRFDNVDLMSFFNTPDKSVLIAQGRQAIKDDAAEQYEAALGKIIDDQRKNFEAQTKSLISYYKTKPVVVNMPDGSVHMIYESESGKKVDIIRGQ